MRVGDILGFVNNIWDGFGYLFLVYINSLIKVVVFIVKLEFKGLKKVWIIVSLNKLV